MSAQYGQVDSRKVDLAVVPHSDTLQIETASEIALLMFKASVQRCGEKIR
jgi:hypothetical protein